MATYQYSALTASGRLMTGTIEAGSTEQASEMLEKMQLTINELTVSKQKLPKTSVGRSEFLLFNQQLASITKAGIPLEKGLRELVDDVSSSSMRKLLIDVSNELQNGRNIEQAIEARQKQFPPLYSKILKAGIQTGRLSEMLMSLNRHLEIAARTRRIIFEAMCYPMIVLAVACIIITDVFIFIIPTFAEVIQDMSGGYAHLPYLTSLFFRMAENVWQFWLIVFAVIAAVTGIWLLFGTTADGRRFKESVYMTIPVIGILYHKSILARMAEAMAMLVSAGCTMPQCLRLSAGATGSEKLKFQAETLAGQIEQGAGIMEAGFFGTMLPRLFLYSVQLGSQRNELENNLYGLSNMYSEQTRCLQGKLQAILLPVMLIFVGGFIALMILAMFLPMVRMVTVMM